LPCLQPAEGPDEPDYLLGEAEENPHAVIPARRAVALAVHVGPFLPVRPAIIRRVSAGPASRHVFGSPDSACQTLGPE